MIKTNAESRFPQQTLVGLKFWAIPSRERQVALSLSAYTIICSHTAHLPCFEELGRSAQSQLSRGQGKHVGLEKPQWAKGWCREHHHPRPADESPHYSWARVGLLSPSSWAPTSHPWGSFKLRKWVSVVTWNVPVCIFFFVSSFSFSCCYSENKTNFLVLWGSLSRICWCFCAGLWKGLKLVQQSLLAAAQERAVALHAPAVSDDLPLFTDTRGCYCHSHQEVTDFYVRCQVIK